MPTAALSPPAAASGPRLPGIRPRMMAFLLFWTAAGMFFGGRAYVNWVIFGGKFPSAVLLLENVLDGYYWAAVCVPIFWLARRFRFTRRMWPLSVLVHAAAAGAIAFGCVAFDVWQGWLLEGVMAPFRPYFRAQFYINVQWYAVMVAAAHAFEIYRRYRDRELAAARLNGQLAESRLEALKMQIQPHFLFNTLHTISELIHEDPDAAERMIVRLGDLLRLTVDSAQTHEVPLAQEMEFLEAYLEIQRTRFHDRLQVEVVVQPGAEDALVPNLVLQPLVENAIRHGTTSRGGVGRILVKAERDDGRLRMEVQDNGTGPADDRPRRRQGVGVSNTRARLEQMYGPEGRLELTHCPVGGTIAAVEIPFRRAAVSATAAAHPVEVTA